MKKVIYLSALLLFFGCNGSEELVVDPELGKLVLSMTYTSNQDKKYISGQASFSKSQEHYTQFGDIIKKMDGVEIVELRDSLRKYISGSNEPVIERNLDGFVLGGEEGPFEIVLDNGTETYTQTLERNSTNYNLLLYNGNPAWEKLDNNFCNVGLVDMDILSTERVAQMFSELKETNAIIFDIRNYPNGTLWYIVNYLF